MRSLLIAALLVSTLPPLAARADDDASTRELSDGLARAAQLKADGWALVAERLTAGGACDAVTDGIVGELRARKAAAIELAEAVKAQRSKFSAAGLKKAQALAKTKTDRIAAAERKSRQAAVLKLRAFAGRCPAQAKELHIRANGYAEILSP